MTNQPNGNGTARKNGRRASIPFATLYSRTDRYGRRYLAGRLGLMKLLIFETAEVSQGDVVWEAIIAQGPHASEEQEARAEQLEEPS